VVRGDSYSVYCIAVRGAGGGRAGGGWGVVGGVEGLLMELPEVKWLIVFKWKSEDTFQR